MCAAWIMLLRRGQSLHLQWAMFLVEKTPRCLAYPEFSSARSIAPQSNPASNSYLSSNTYLLSTTCDSIFSISPSNLTLTCPPSCFALQLALTSPL